MGLEIVQELFFAVAYKDPSGMIAVKRFRSKENADKYASLHEEHSALCMSMSSMNARVKDLESEMSFIEPGDIFSDGRVGNIIEGEVQCFSK